MIFVTGEVVSWGMGSEGTLGTGQSADCSTPTPAVTPPLAPRVPVHISAGGQHTVLLVVCIILLIIQPMIINVFRQNRVLVEIVTCD